MAMAASRTKNIYGFDGSCNGVYPGNRRIPFAGKSLSLVLLKLNFRYKYSETSTAD